MERRRTRKKQRKLQEATEDIKLKENIKTRKGFV